MPYIPRKYQTRRQREYSDENGNNDIPFRYLTRNQRAHLGGNSKSVRRGKSFIAPPKPKLTSEELEAAHKRSQGIRARMAEQSIRDSEKEQGMNVFRRAYRAGRRAWNATD